MTDTIPQIASPQDIDKDLAARAFNNTSFSPEQRGESRRKEYADDVNGLYAQLLPLAKTDEQKALLAEEMERYRQGCITRMNAYLHSHSNVASSMITGPARFPTARNQKRSQWADNKANQLFEWQQKGRQAIKRKLLDARPQDEKDAADWRMLERDITSSLNAIRGIDAGTLPYTRSAFVNSIVGKVERLSNNGEVELVRKALELVSQYNASHEKEAITKRHSFWSLGAIADQHAAKSSEAANSEPETIATAKGVEIVINRQADRVQIVFADKPDIEMIGKLKSEAWKWSPNAGAWQRKLTEAAKQSAKRIVGIE